MDINDKIQEGIRLINEEAYDKSVTLAKEIQEADPDSSDGYHLEAIALQHMFKWQDSITALNKAIEHSPYDASLYSVRAFAKMSTEDFIGAEEDLDEAIDLEDYEPAHRNKVILKIIKNNSEEAINYLLDRLEKNPKDVENWILMGDLMKRVGMDDKADTYYEQAKELNPEHPAFQKEAKNGK